GKVVRGWLGVSIQQVTPELAKQFGLSETKGALVSEVIENSPAAAAGLQSGDIITALDGKTIEGPSMLRNLVARVAVGKVVKVDALRDRKTISVNVTVTEQPKEVAQTEEESVQGEGKGGALAGVEVRALTPDILRQLGLPAGSAGIVVAGVPSASPAESAGLQQGDVITEINRQPVRNLADFRRLTGKLGKKQNVLLYVNRQGRKLFIAIKP
ncbi:MAG TPA: PDZ domain-containing protein, partial [Burkholderiales bacterium]|nr:PDZ domain-containing protein [Burkholderiales bacterium]